jgi:hypothetical protein
VLTKRQDENTFRASLTQQANAIFQTADEFGHAMWRDEDGRVRMKRQDGGTQATIARVIAGCLEQGLMAAMDAVKIADGERTRAKAALCGIHGEVNSRRAHTPNRPMAISKPS